MEPRTIWIDKLSFKKKMMYVYRHTEAQKVHCPQTLENIYRENTQIKGGNIITDNSKIVRIIKSYHKKLHANKLDNLEGMDKFLGT